MTPGRAAFILASAIALATCPPSAAPASPADYSKGRLWRIAKPGVPDSFVFGTIHVADPRVTSLPEPVVKAMAGVRLLAMEMAPAEAAASHYGDLELLDDGGRLEPLIGAPAFDRVRADLTAHGTPEDVVARLKPWAAMMKLTWGRSRSDARTLDENLLAAARDRRLRFVSLESIDEQVAAFDSIPIASQIALLRNAVEHRDALERMTEPTIAAWQRGDLAELARLNERFARQFPGMPPHYAELTRRIIEGRTVLMHHRLFMPLRSGGVLVAVGALHLYGNAGLLKMLAEDGYRVTRVW
jgi:uncharacterized protein YbaP (TraB family)